MSEEKKFIHRFEEAGLGKAPFRLIEVVTRRYCPAPGVSYPGDACDYCSTGIVQCCEIQDANGKVFTVGNECVRHTGDAGLIDVMRRKSNELKREERHEKERQKIEGAQNLLADEEIRASLARKVHPYAWKAAQGSTLLDYCVWMMNNAGNKGKLEAAKQIKAQLDPETFKLDQSAEIEQNRDSEQARKENYRQALDAIRPKYEEKFAELTRSLVADQSDVIAVLKKKVNSPFCQSIALDLETSTLHDLSEKAWNIVCEIYAKAAGRYNSFAYNEANKKLGLLRASQRDAFHLLRNEEERERYLLREKFQQRD